MDSIAELEPFAWAVSFTFVVLGLFMGTVSNDRFDRRFAHALAKTGLFGVMLSGLLTLLMLEP